MENETRKCIAVIISKPERKYQEGLLKGVSQSAFAHHMNVAVFAATLLEGPETYQWGEQQIFDLINYERFSGIIYAVDSFYNHSVTKVLNEKLLAASAKGIPVVTIDGKVDGLPSFFNDDSNAVKDLIHHLIREHEVRDIAYMTGHQGHPHAENSLRAYKEAMAEHHLPILPGRTYYGDYWYHKADSFINQLTESENGLPQAIVCANEHMAIGIYRTLHARGIYVPKQIRLGCTSNDASAARYLMTAENTLENVGFEACETILRALCGEHLPTTEHHVPCKTTFLSSVSCGCQKASEYDYSIERGVWVDTSPGFFGESNFFREEIFSKKSFSSLFKKFDGNLRHIQGFSGLYFCMCSGWNDPHFFITDVRKNSYTDQMQLYYYHREKPEAEMFIGENRSFPKTEMFPDLFDDQKEPAIYVFRSLHFMDRNFGYVVLDNGQSTQTYDYAFNFWLRDVANSLEAQCRLQSVNYMYYTDIMTGLYNRNGFNTQLDAILEEAASGQQQILVALSDMNGLKHINDTYGHEEGDVAIKAAAALLKNQKIPCAVYEKNFRIGGDEFVKIAVGHFSQADIDAFKEKLYACADAFTASSGKPYRTQMSVGICVSTAGNTVDIDALLSQADKKMYAEKQRLKAARQG